MMVRRADGELEPVTEGSTKQVVEIRTHAGIVKTRLDLRHHVEIGRILRSFNSDNITRPARSNASRWGLSMQLPLIGNALIQCPQCGCEQILTERIAVECHPVRCRL
jgi:hypothetical protein